LNCLAEMAKSHLKPARNLFVCSRSIVKFETLKLHNIYQSWPNNKYWMVPGMDTSVISQLNENKSRTLWKMD